MKKQLLTLLAMVTIMTIPLQIRADDIPINDTNFPDANFRNWVLTQSYGKDGVLTNDEIAGVTTILVERLSITDLKGIEYFTALTRLYCRYNQLTSLNLTKNTALEYLYCDGNKLTSLDVSNNVSLKILSCPSNKLTSLNISKSTEIKELQC